MDELQIMKMIAFYQTEAIRALRDEVKDAHGNPNAFPVCPTQADVAEKNVKTLYEALYIQQDYKVRLATSTVSNGN